MELSRRDAVAALATIGVGGAAVAYARSRSDSSGSGDGAGDGGDSGVTDDQTATPGPTVASEEALLSTAATLAEVVYPSEVEGSAEFGQTYVAGRIADDDAHRTGVAAAVGTLDERAEDSHGAPFRELEPADGDALLSEMGMQSVEPDPDGSDRERVRYYLVNELLYGLMTSPKGGALVGIENPPGHAGGLEAYQQGPQG